MKSNRFVLFFFLAALFLVSCNSSRKAARENVSVSGAIMVSPPVIIYQTRADYRMHVPVILSEDRKSLLSYPAPGDVYYQGELAYPLELENGYLLDRRGIGPGVAFLKYTYYEYSRLDKTPSQAELMSLILDSDPLTVMYHCGQRHEYKDLVNELNELIRSGKVANYKRLDD